MRTERRPPTYLTYGLALLAGAVLALPGSARADESPVNEPPLRRSAVDEVDRNVAPEGVPLTERELPTFAIPALEPRIVPAEEGVHRGGVSTDGSRGGVAPEPNSIERAKLEMARAAVEASRAAGTLHAMELPDDTLPATLEELERMKMQALADRVSRPLPEDPAALSAGEFPSVQESGAPGLTPYEEAKLRGENPEPTRATPVSPELPGSGDGAPVANQEVTRDE